MSFDDTHKIKRLSRLAIHVSAAECNPRTCFGHFEIVRTATSEQLPGTAFSTVVVRRAWK